MPGYRMIDDNFDRRPDDGRSSTMEYQPRCIGTATSILREKLPELTKEESE